MSNSSTPPLPPSKKVSTFRKRSRGHTSQNEKMFTRGFSCGSLETVHSETGNPEDEDDHGTIATSSTTRVANSNNKYQSETSQWIQAKEMLQENPKLLTLRVFLVSLQHQVPVEVVRFMLLLNPEVANIPKEGPTPLQVAVEHGASPQIIQLLLEACPFALCVTNPQHSMDPLFYAKCNRSNEPHVLDLLSRPLSYWVMKNQKARPNQRKDNILTTRDPISPSNRARSSPAVYSASKKQQQQQQQQAMDGSTSSDTDSYYSSDWTPDDTDYFARSPPKSTKSVGSSSDDRSAFPFPYGSANASLMDLSNQQDQELQQPGLPNVPHKNSTRSQQEKDRIRREELDNVKLLCAQVLKGQKRLSKQFQAYQQQDSQPLSASSNNNSKLLDRIQQSQKDQFYKQLVALDMKERAFAAKARRVAQEQVEESFQSWTDWKEEMDRWKEETKEVLQETKLIWKEANGSLQGIRRVNGGGGGGTRSSDWKELLSPPPAQHHNTSQAAAAAAVPSSSFFKDPYWPEEYLDEETKPMLSEEQSGEENNERVEIILPRQFQFQRDPNDEDGGREYYLNDKRGGGGKKRWKLPLCRINW